MAHSCHALGCTVETPPRLFMCRPHWAMVPKEMQDTVWKTYRPGQERDKQPSERYLIATMRARIVVAEAEGRKVPEGYRTALGVWEQHERDRQEGARP